jgi:hypothetical protein
LAIFTALVTLTPGRWRISPGRCVDPPIHELIAPIGFLLLPFLCYIAAISAVGALQQRFVLPTVIGSAVLTAFAVRRLFGSRRLPAAALVLVLAACALGGEARIMMKQRSVRGELREMEASAADAVDRFPGIPVVIGDNDLFTQLSYYARPDLGSRLTYLTDVAAARRLAGNDITERKFVALRPWTSFHLVDYSEFVAQHKRFLLASPAGSWQMKRLLAEHALLSAVGIFADQPLLEVDLAETP